MPPSGRMRSEGVLFVFSSKKWKVGSVKCYIGILRLSSSPFWWATQWFQHAPLHHHTCRALAFSRHATDDVIPLAPTDAFHTGTGAFRHSKENKIENKYIFLCLLPQKSISSLWFWHDGWQRELCNSFVLLFLSWNFNEPGGARHWSVTPLSSRPSVNFLDPSYPCTHIPLSQFLSSLSLTLPLSFLSLSILVSPSLSLVLSHFPSLVHSTCELFNE